MKHFFSNKSVILFFLLFFSISAFGKGAWVYSYSTEKWHFFPTLCCQQFIIDWPLGDMCFNIDNSCQARPGGDKDERNSGERLDAETPSFSSLTEVCQFELIVDATGNGTIFQGNKRVATLTPDGLSTFFSEKPCFFTSNEVSLTVEGNRIISHDDGSQIAKVKDGVIAHSAVDLGQLSAEQVQMIQRIGTPAPKEIRQKYNLEIVPNPVSEKSTLTIISARNQTAKVKLVNLYGNVIKQYSMELIHGQNTLVLDFKEYNPGTYIVVVETKEVFLSEKIIKQ